MSVQAPPAQMYLARARASSNSKDCMDIYDQWAATYNDEVRGEGQSYVPLVAQMAIRSSSKSIDAVVLDAGCGTGLVGQALAEAGVKIVDGIDLSPAMLRVADKTGVYRRLAEADLTQAIRSPSDTYDIVTCAGTFTTGHVGPDPALRELIRITKRNGVIVSTILEEIWITGGFQAEVEKLAASNLVTVITDSLIDYVKGRGDKAVLLVLKKNEVRENL